MQTVDRSCRILKKGLFYDNINLTMSRITIHLGFPQPSLKFVGPKNVFGALNVLEKALDFVLKNVYGLFMLLFRTHDTSCWCHVQPSVHHGLSMDCLCCYSGHTIPAVGVTSSPVCIMD